jgi:hypothetical protein
VCHDGARHHREQLARNMGRLAVAARRKANLAGIGFGVGDEFGDRFGRNRRMDYHHERPAEDAGDRRDVADEVVTELLVKGRVNGLRGVEHKQCVAVRTRAHDDFGGNVAACSRPVLDDECLTKSLR